MSFYISLNHLNSILQEKKCHAVLHILSSKQKYKHIVHGKLMVIQLSDQHLIILLDI